MHERETAVEKQLIALAGLLQACYLVDMLAQTGNAPDESLNPSIRSLFVFDPPTAAAVYGGRPGIKLGLRLLRDMLGASRHREPQTSRYALAVLHLQKKLQQQPEMNRIIHSRLQHSAINLEHFNSDIKNIASSVGAIYQDTISSFRFRIQVVGSARQLQDPQCAELIRSLLLAAIRAAVLWRQSGGRRWHIVTRRRQYLALIDDWLSD